MNTKNINDYIKIQDLNKNILTLIRNLCLGDYSNITCVDNLPFFCFHINFKKTLLELLLKDMINKGKVNEVDINKLLSIFNTDNNKISTIDNITLSNFKLKKLENYTKFDMQLYVTYTNEIIKILEKTTYKKFVNALSAVTNIEVYTIEDLGKDFEIVEDMLDDEPEFFIWNEIKSTSIKEGKIFYHLNSEVEKNFYYSKGILLYPIDEHEENKKRIDKNLFIKSFEGKISIAEKELIDYYKKLYSVLINNIAPIDTSIVIKTLSLTFGLLLKKQFGNAVLDAMLEISNTKNESLSLQDLGEYLGVHTASFGERLNSMHQPKVSDIIELYKIAYKLNKPSDYLLGLKLNENNFDFTESTIQQYIEDKYGLNSNTLDILEVLQNYYKSSKESSERDELNKGLNGLLSSKYVLLTPIYKNNPKFINITDEQMCKLREIYDKGVELKENTNIEEIITAGYQEKKLGNLKVRYNKKNIIIIDGEVKIIRNNVREEYNFDNIVVTAEEASSKRVYRIIRGNISNIAFLKDKQVTFLDIDINGYRNLVIGREESDFLTPLLRFLGSNNTTLLTIKQRDLDIIHNDYNGVEYAIEDFYEDISTSYGSLKFESDNLQLLEIITRLKNFKYGK